MEKNSGSEKAAIEGKETSIQLPPSADVGLAGILGDISYLMMRSEAHRHLFISDMEWLVLPALRLKQMRVFRDKQKPLAYISWAHLTEETEKRLLSGNSRLAPREWNAGNRIWIIDSICSTPTIYPFLKALHNQAFKGREAHMALPKKNSRGLEGVFLTEVLKKMEKNLTQGTKH